MSVETARSWLKVAKSDLRQVRNNLFGPEPTTSGAAFHCQQAAEKLVKALLVLEDIAFRKTHDIEALVALLPSNHQLRPAVSSLEHLTPFATIYRYPAEDEPEEPTQEDVTQWLHELEQAATLVEQAASEKLQFRSSETGSGA
jgi:HEPN domain-containing protein